MKGTDAATEESADDQPVQISRSGECSTLCHASSLDGVFFYPCRYKDTLKLCSECYSERAGYQDLFDVYTGAYLVGKAVCDDQMDLVDSAVVHFERVKLSEKGNVQRSLGYAMMGKVYSTYKKDLPKAVEQIEYIWDSLEVHGYEYASYLMKHYILNEDFENALRIGQEALKSGDISKSELTDDWKDLMALTYLRMGDTASYCALTDSFDLNIDEQHQKDRVCK